MQLYDSNIYEIGVTRKRIRNNSTPRFVSGISWDGLNRAVINTLSQCSLPSFDARAFTMEQ